MDKMSAGNKFWRQNKAARAIRGSESGVPTAVQGKCSPKWGGIQKSIEGVYDIAALW